MVKNKGKEVGGEPMAQGNPLPLTKMSFPFLAKAKGSSRDREVALPLCTSFDFVVWEDLGAAWAFCSSLNSYVVRRMLRNYNIC